MQGPAIYQDYYVAELHAVCKILTKKAASPQQLVPYTGCLSIWANSRVCIRAWAPSGLSAEKQLLCRAEYTGIERG